MLVASTTGVALYTSELSPEHSMAHCSMQTCIGSGSFWNVPEAELRTPEDSRCRAAEVKILEDSVTSCEAGSSPIITY